ncbi:MAG: serine/threonine-protein phosphatase [Deltaproteobacteria bacterium]|nr:serine/threonine-protein phosphatase [Deltaproteobacteria bacterium]
MTLACDGRSVVGRRRSNQDAMLLRPRSGVFAVADGMGGYEGGEVASALVVAAIDTFMGRLDIDPEGTWPQRSRASLGPLAQAVDVALRAADHAVRRERRGRLARMGSTAVLAWFHRGQLALAHVGDSRLYRLRAQLELLTDDHSVAAELTRSGMPAEVVSPALLACLTRAIGMDGAAEPALRLEPVCAGDRYLLCSDGLWGALDDDAIADVLAHCRDDGRACEALVEDAYHASSTDNITAVVVTVHGVARMP